MSTLCSSSVWISGKRDKQKSRAELERDQLKSKEDKAICSQVGFSSMLLADSPRGYWIHAASWPEVLGLVRERIQERTQRRFSRSRFINAK
jgi:hypothetical protein